MRTSHSFENNHYVSRGGPAQRDERLIFWCSVPILDRCNVGKFDPNRTSRNSEIIL